MTEAAGVVLGVAGLAGLFTSCIDCYQLVRRGAALDKDYRILETKFNNQELRLSAWGRACGLLGDDDYDERLDEQALRTRIIATLQCVKALFDDERELRKRFGLKPCRGSSSPSNRARTPLALPMARSDAALSPKPRKRESFFFWRKQQRNAPRLRDQVAWAISDRDKFSELVQHLKDFNDDLAAMTQPFPEMATRQRRIVEMEIEEVQDMTTLDEIAEAAQGDDGLISDVVSVRIASIRSGSSILTGRGTGASGTAKSFWTALTSIPTPIDEGLEETHRDEVEAPLTRRPLLKKYKLVLVGDLDADKTLLLCVMLRGSYPEVYVPTVLENYVMDITIDGYDVELAPWDTSQQEDYDRLRPLSYPDSHVILLCFRANNPTAATKKNILERWLPELDHFCPGVPIILVGIRARDDFHDDGGPSPTSVEAEDLFVPFTIRKEIGSARYFFCDPSTNFGIRELLEYSTRAAIRYGDGLEERRMESTGAGGIMSRMRSFMTG
ncbi:prion-inhibition and propagation-domain-containing protein [Immersiella caudata]|uniref:Prion-inhibition and propagation-domain-containing protein n=1 Tax=Immersiella caudata TaxID=314043 RepID=A0AA40BX08_9PEZI|nr:prion-inhibition and propagation-domain-containing protein [Immersiella caudata]